MWRNKQLQLCEITKTKILVYIFSVFSYVNFQFLNGPLISMGISVQTGTAFDMFFPQYLWLVLRKVKFL